MGTFGDQATTLHRLHRAGETEAKAKLLEKLVAASATVSC